MALSGIVELGQWLDSMILAVFSDRNDSVILQCVSEFLCSLRKAYDKIILYRVDFSGQTCFNCRIHSLLYGNEVFV